MNNKQNHEDSKPYSNKDALDTLNELLTPTTYQKVMDRYSKYDFCVKYPEPKPQCKPSLINYVGSGEFGWFPLQRYAQYDLTCSCKNSN